MKTIKNIVAVNMSSYHDWVSRGRGFRNRNYYIVRELTRMFPEAKVLHVNRLPLSFTDQGRILLDDYLRRPGRHHGHIKRLRIGSQLRQWDAQTFEYFIKRLVPNKSARVFDDLARVMRGLGMYPAETLLWSYHPLFWLPFTRRHEICRAAVFDAVDDWSKLPHLQRLGLKTNLETGYRAIAERADMVFAVSTNVHESLHRTKHLEVVPNGVEVDAYVQTKEKRRTLVASRSSRPLVGYHGVIQERFDVDLLEAVAKALPRVQFEIAGHAFGPVKKQLAVLRHLPNVELTGRFGTDKIPAILSRWHVAFMPHKVSALTRSMSPMKIYEYMAAGLPIVTTTTDGFEVQTGTTQASDAAACVRAIEQALSGKVVVSYNLHGLSWADRFAAMRNRLKAANIVP